MEGAPGGGPFSLSLQLWLDSAQAGGGASLCPAVVPPPRSPLLQLSQLHQSHPGLGGRRGPGEEGASWVCPAEATLAPASERSLQLPSEEAGVVCAPHPHPQAPG